MAEMKGHIVTVFSEDVTDPESEFFFTNLKPELRREYLAHRLMGSPQKITGAALATELGVSESSISLDISSQEFVDTCREIMLRFIRGTLMSHAMKNIAKSIIEDKNLKTSKWLMEKSGFMIEDILLRTKEQTLDDIRDIVNGET